jgi:lysophospholipid acyltransferase (LPLAT)-like uncharacterized protein
VELLKPASPRPTNSRLISGWLNFSRYMRGTSRPGAVERTRPSLTSIFLSLFAATYIRLVGWTSQIIWVNRSIRDEQEASGKGFIYAFWHGRQVFLVYLHRGDQLSTIISRSRDGEIIARVCAFFGLGAVRGSSSRGGGTALLKMHELLNHGQRVAFTPDGPKGPLRQIQPGVLFLARKTGCPIVPVAFGAKKKWIFRGRWDEFVVPKPLNRIAMVYGEPIRISADDSMDKKSTELKWALNDVMAKADSVAAA